MTKQRAITLLKVSVTLIGLVLVLTQVPIGEIVDEIRHARIAGLLLAVVFIVIGLVIRAVRWSILLQGVGTKVSFGRLLQLYFVGAFFNGFLPSGFGGDALRIVELSQDVPQETATGTVLVDRISGLVALFIMALIVIAVAPDVFPTDFLLRVGLICAGGLIIGILALGGWRWFPFIDKLPERLPGMLGRPLAKLLAALKMLSLTTVIQSVIISMIFNFSLVAMWQAVSWALRYDISYLYLTGVVPIMSIALLVPSVGGLGVREVIAPLLLAGAGLEPAEAVTLSLTILVVKRIAELSGAPVYLYSQRNARHRLQER